MNNYLILSMTAYAVVLFLTLRDIRIFKRTRHQTYRKGAMRGIAASGIILLGAVIVSAGNHTFGMLIVMLGLYMNNKGPREDVFYDAPVMERFFGKTRHR